MASIALLNKIADYNARGRGNIPVEIDNRFPLGSGCYSTVYPDPESEYHVIKCGGGDAWANYAAYCIDHPDNPHLPRIQFLKVTGEGKPRYVASVEKLMNINDYQGTPKGPSRKQIISWCNILGFYDRDDDSNWLWDHFKEASDDPLWQTLYDINCKIGRTRDLSYGHNIMVRSDGTLVITDPIADDHYKGVDKYNLKNFTYDGYVIPERAHSNERYMVRKEVRYTEPSVRPETQDRPLQATQSIAVCDARTGQVLGLLPQVSGKLPTHDGASLPERYTATEVAKKRNEVMGQWANLRDFHPQLWKIPVMQSCKPFIAGTGKIEPINFRWAKAGDIHIASRLHGGVRVSRAVMAAKGRG